MALIAAAHLPRRHAVFPGKKTVEIALLIETAHQEAFDILVANRSILDQMVLELLDRETLNKEEIEVIFAKVASWPRRPAWTGSVHRIPSTQAPVAVPVRKVIPTIKSEAVKPVAKKPARTKKAIEE